MEIHRVLTAFVYQETRQSEWLIALKDSGQQITQDDVQLAMVTTERSSADKTSTRVILKILDPVVRVLSDYTGVVDTLADPMPTCLIWSAKRFLQLFDEIKDQLDSLRIHLCRLKAYEDLFRNSTELQELLQRSYISVIRFWLRVDKECNRCAPNRGFRSLASFSTSKLDEIVASIEKDANNIYRLVPIIQEHLQRSERESQAEERLLASKARAEQSDELRLRDRQRRNERKRDVYGWLKADTLLFEGNYRYQERYASLIYPGTYLRLLKDQLFREWLATGKSTSNIWLRASPGFEKSVLCAFTIQEVMRQRPASCSVFHYFSFDEEFRSELQIYRSLAQQLANQVWTRLGDIPEDVYVYTQQTSMSVKTEDIKAVIRLLVQKLSEVFIFLDGLDEECNDGRRWERLREVIDFISGLSSQQSPRVRLWCSSQDRALLRPLMRHFKTIDITRNSSEADIAIYLRHSIMAIDSLDIDEGSQTLIIEELCAKAMGSFLWASLMIDMVAKAPSLYEVQEQISNGLPDDCEKYYQRKVDDIASSDRKFASTLLACIVYAKRPLRLEELCEATAALNTKDGCNIDKSQKLFKSKLLKLCEPLVQIHEIKTEYGAFSTCTLCHSSVRNFLLKNPNVFTGVSDCSASQVDGKVVANICLRYLSQPCYERKLTMSGDTFTDLDGEDIAQHYMLGYAAKYWDKHFDELPFSQEFCDRVKSFIQSPQFHTCLQVQSLLVEAAIGQFQVWYSALDESAGPQFRRVFPKWLEDLCGRTLARNYLIFVYEWGNLFNQVISQYGEFPGETDRCFWNALGPQNFLHTGRSRYKSFSLVNENDAQYACVPTRFFDGIDTIGGRVMVVVLETGQDSSSEPRFRCQEWILKNGRSPKLQRSQQLDVEDAFWQLYDKPGPKTLLGRPVPVAFAHNLEYLRIGCRLFSYSIDNGFVPIEGPPETATKYFEEIGARGPYVAISSRRSTIEEALETEPMDADQDLNSNAIYDYGETLAQIHEEHMKTISVSISTATATTQNTSDNLSSDGSDTSTNTSMSGSSVRDDEEDEDLLEAPIKESNIKDVDLNDLEDDFSEADSNSAATSWTEASSDRLSDELENEDQWNDWEDDAFAVEEQPSEDRQLGEDQDDVGSVSQMNLQGYQTDSESDMDDPEDASDKSDESGFEVSGPLGVSLHGFRRSSTNPSVCSVESNYSASYAASSTDQGESESDDKDARRLQDLLSGGRKSGGSDKPTRVWIRVYNTHMEDKSQPIFHFSQDVSGRIFVSPPVVHPSKPLLVWPLGDGEILFANLEGNTYFTRLLGCSDSKNCYVFIKAHFSSDGEHLHFAALEAQEADNKQLEQNEGQKSLNLYLQVSSHRLSVRKTARSPPRLIFRTTIFLGKTASLAASNLPYTITWAAKELYLTERKETLTVTRIPLFRPPSANPDCPTTRVCYNQAKVFLPRMENARNAYFFPPPSETREPSSRHKNKTKSKSEIKQPKATVIVGSHSSIPSQSFFVPRNLISPPVGVYLDEGKDMGGWACKPVPEDGAIQGKANDRGGRLRAKYETFDLTNDCDIVPYLS